MVFKSTGSNSRFQRKNRFWQICTESQDINKKVSKIGLPNQTSNIWHIFADISGLGAYFSKPIFALKLWVRAGRFEYHQPYNPNNFFFTYKGVRSQFKLKRGQGRWHPILKNFIFLKSTLKMHPGFTRDKIRKELFWFLHNPNLIDLVARFYKVCRYDRLRCNSCYDKLGCNSLVVIVLLLRPD